MKTDYKIASMKTDYIIEIGMTPKDPIWRHRVSLFGYQLVLLREFIEVVKKLEDGSRLAIYSKGTYKAI